MSSPVFTFTTTGVRVLVYAEQADGSVRFSFQTALDEGYRVDLNGFFLDIGGNGGTIWSVGSPANNMNGSGADGYDYAAVLGTVGGNDADWHNGTIIIDGITLDQLEGSDAGLRATSYGPNGEGSFKLTAAYTPPSPPPDHFPRWLQDISHIVLVFNTAAGDSGKAGSARMDGYYTVKIDNWPSEADDDLDNSIDAILAWLESCDPVLMRPDLVANDLLLGAVIKGGTQNTQYFAYGIGNSNGTDPDPLPTGLGFSLPVDDPATKRNEAAGTVVTPNAIDASYDYSAIFGPCMEIARWEILGA